MKQPPLKAILVDVVPHGTDTREAKLGLNELTSLVETLEGITVEKVIQKRGRPSAKTFLGTGKTQEVGQLIKHLHADVVIFNNVLKPSQVMFLNTILNAKVWDRVDLILNIFDKHAKTKESKLQIDLARLHHEFPKLYGKGVNLSQQSGGGASVTGVRGPGEKKLEQKKRYLRREIKKLEDQLKKIKKQRQSQRDVRKRKNLKTVALVGYTNSGKSTLLKAMTGKKNVYVADQLFATLDTKIGNIYVDGIGDVLIADTIGFMKDLPPFLIKSFLATLEEVKEADVILHVVDISDPEVVEKARVVEDILKDLGCDEKPRVNALNKIDKIKNEPMNPPENTVLISAEKGKNLDKLMKELSLHID
jgi:GTPase